MNFIEFFEFLNTNKEWLFSGVGLAAVAGVVKLVKRLSKQKDNNSTDGGLRNSNKTAPSSTEVAKLAKRFNLTIEMMNKNNIEPLTVAKIAQILKLSKISAFENFLLGKEEPSFEFISNYAETFGINEEWLNSGSGNPFDRKSEYHLKAMEYFDYILNSEPRVVYFIKADTETAQMFIVLRLDDYRYEVLDSIWHISDHVGGTGRSQLLSVYNLITKLYTPNFEYWCTGRVLPSKEFDQLFEGKVYPGSILEFRPSNNPWWDDLMDVYHKYPIAPGYAKAHGASFIKAQGIIREELERTS